LASLLTSFPLKIFDSLSLLAAADWKEPKPRSKPSQSIIDYFLLIIYLLPRRLFAQCNPGLFSRHGSHNSRAGYPPSTLGVFTAHKMTGTSALAPDLAGSGNLDSFAQPLMCLLFRHLQNLVKKYKILSK
jgi:hypothetical protein